MKGYFSHAAYDRWYRQYLYQLDNHVLRLDAIRRAVAQITSLKEERAALEYDIYEIDEKLQDIIPRSFLPDQKPLTTGEVLQENLKIILNLGSYFFPDFRMPSIFEKERDRVLKARQEYPFTEKITEIQNKLDAVLKGQKEAAEVEAMAAASGAEKTPRTTAEKTTDNTKTAEASQNQ